MAILHITYKNHKMKVIKLFMLLVASSALFISCQKETTYTIISPSQNEDLNGHGPLTGTIEKLHVFEYSANNEKLYNYSIELEPNPIKKVITPQRNTVKIKAALNRKHLIRGVVTSVTDSWYQRVFYLEEGKNTSIDLSDASIPMGNEEP